MISKCKHDDCKNRTGDGWCCTSVCIHPTYKYDGVYANPSRICSVCGKSEYPNSVYATTTFWLCDDCLRKLKKLIQESDK